MKYENINEKALNQFYDEYDEDARLIKSYHGQLEYFTTMTYIQKYLKKGMRILEIGAGTGRYSIQLAREGYDVTAVELVKSNVKILKQNAKGLKNICALQGDALDLSKLADQSFDMVLVLGPMYHLYNKKDQTRAIDEALRVCKKGGILMFAFIPVHSFIYGFGMDGGQSVVDVIKKNFTEKFEPIQFPDQFFTAFEIADFKALFKNKPFKQLNLVATDGLMYAEEDRKNFNMTDEDFEFFKKYHLSSCENPGLLGLSAHLLYIGKKQ